MNRPLLHAEELEGSNIADGPICTCTSGAYCPMCGSAPASETCEVHNGRTLAESIKRHVEDLDPADDRVAKIVKNFDLAELLGDRDVGEVTEYLLDADEAAVLETIGEALEKRRTAEQNKKAPEDGLCPSDVADLLKGGELLTKLLEDYPDQLREWIEENVTGCLETDDPGNKVPNIKIEGL